VIAHKKLFRYVMFAALWLTVLSIAATLIAFPWHIDPERDESKKAAEFYERAYAAALDVSPISVPELTEQEKAYGEVARKAAIDVGVPGLVADFVRQYSLENKRVLDVGSGNGLLQDAVTDYTGLDISPAVRRFYHKSFVEASATDMPFPAATFDALWSIWVLEHIPNPERALNEMRRVLKPGGVMFLMPAFDVTRYQGQGYAVRRYSDFNWIGKLIKASIPVAKSKFVHYLHDHQIRLMRSIGVRFGGGPSSLRFVRLRPNYDRYWQPDSDAAISVSAHELYLWFKTRGDECLNCPSEARLTLRDPGLFYLVIRKR
jgi:SAM-dependent methyltransferase